MLACYSNYQATIVHAGPSHCLLSYEVILCSTSSLSTHIPPGFNLFLHSSSRHHLSLLSAVYLKEVAAWPLMWRPHLHTQHVWPMNDIVLFFLLDDSFGSASTNRLYLNHKQKDELLQRICLLQPLTIIHLRYQIWFKTSSFLCLVCPCEIQHQDPPLTQADHYSLLLSQWREHLRDVCVSYTPWAALFTCLRCQS